MTTHFPTTAPRGLGHGYNAVIIAAFTALMVASADKAQAQAPSRGTLTVTATVESSIQLTFDTDGSGGSSTGAGTSAASLTYGTMSAYGPIAAANVTRIVGATDFSVTSTLGLKVVKANSSSASYTLHAALGSADATNTGNVTATVLTTSGAVAPIRNVNITATSN